MVRPLEKTKKKKIHQGLLLSKLANLFAIGPFAFWFILSQVKYSKRHIKLTCRFTKVEILVLVHVCRGAGVQGAKS